jgi:hypothetical protein
VDIKANAATAFAMRGIGRILNFLTGSRTRQGDEVFIAFYDQVF